MSHHHREDEIYEPSSVETPNKLNHPLFEANDLTYLSLILPLLSEPGKKLISFFINFNNPNPKSANTSSSDPINLLKQIAPKLDNSSFKELLPNLLNNVLSNNQENKNMLNPGLLSSLLANVGNIKEEKE